MQLTLTLTLTSFLLVLSNAQDYILPDNIVPKKYEISLYVDPVLDVFDGEVNITFTTNKSTNELFLHASPQFIVISKVSMKNDDCRILASNNITEIVIISCPFVITSNENVLNIEYKGYYSEDYRGIFKETADEELIILTHLQPTFARRVFPCLDEPKYKATFDITVYHPPFHTARGNNIVLKKDYVNR